MCEILIGLQIDKIIKDLTWLFIWAVCDLFFLCLKESWENFLTWYLQLLLKCKFLLDHFFYDLILAYWLEYSPIARETGVQSPVESDQRLKKWYLISPCLTLNIIRYVPRVKWSNPRKGVVPFRTPRCSSYWKGGLRVGLDYSCQLYYETGSRIMLIFLDK